MLEKLIAIPHLVVSFMTGHSDLSNPESLTRYQKPPIYAQASYGNENLSTILKQAETLAATRPHLAIALYRRVMVEGGPLAEKAVERALEIYNKKLQKLSLKDYDRWELENALSFFNEVVKKHPKYVAEAYLKSGEILCDLLFWIPERIPEAMERLEEAYKRGDNLIKAKARFKQGWTENLITGIVDHFWYHEIYPILLNSYSNVKRAERHLIEVMKLAPQSEEAKMARNLLEIHGVLQAEKTK